MPVNYSITVLNDRLDAVVANIDGGGGPGFLNLYLTDNTLVGVITLAQPSATSSGGVLYFNGLPLNAPLTLASGDVASAQIVDYTGTIVVSGLTVGVSSAYDLVMQATTVSSGQTIALTYATITGQ